MEKKEFQRLAVRTESVVDEIKITDNDYQIFFNTLKAFAEMGNILDVYKKHIFYGKDVSYDDILKRTYNVQHNLDRTREYLSIADYYSKTPNLKAYDFDPRVFHALLGTITEHTEIAEALIEAFKGNELDLVNVCEELGDSDWYKALFYDATNISWDDVQAMVIKKLENRFRDKIFTEEEAKERDLEEERRVLEACIRGQVDDYEATRAKE